MSEERSGCPDLPDSLSVPFLLNLSRGITENHYSPQGRSGHIELLHNSPGLPPTVSNAGSFCVSCKGMFNTTEEAELALGPHRISFSRKGYNGEWWFNGSRAATTKISFCRRWLWCGYSETRMSDGETFRITTPTLGPSSRQMFNCVSTVRFASKLCLHMFLAKPHRQNQVIFDQSEVALLEQLPEWTRGILLGEHLRLRAVCGGGD
jgi:hypothetical protein